MMKANDSHLYLQVADSIEKLIGEEVFKIGDKLPSVRIMSAQKGISMGTAFQAYYHLESKGLIESRPKSGYYVRFNIRRFRDIPSISKPEPVVNAVSTAEMLSSVLLDMTDNVMLNLSIAVPALDFLPLAKLNKSMLFALRSASHGLEYENIQGNLELRKQLAKRFFTWGGKYSASEIVITAGCMEAIMLCLKAVTRPGDTIAIENPTYFGIFQIAEILGLKVFEVPTDPRTGVDLNELAKATKRFGISACVFVPNFNNPLGSCMPNEKKRMLVELLSKKQIPLIEDDIYGDLYFTSERPRTCKSFDKEGWVLHCGSFSKSLAPGYRIGWVIPGRFKEKLLQLKTMHNISTTTITQQALAHFFTIGRYDYHLKRLRSALQTQCMRYMHAIVKYFPPDSRVSRPQGGFVLWLQLNRKVNAFKIYQEAAKRNISIAPGQLFSAQGNLSNCLRISYARPWDNNVEKALKILGDLVAAS
jgi:DNA-binding transcriptional MocR family regulator